MWRSTGSSQRFVISCSEIDKTGNFVPEVGVCPVSKLDKPNLVLPLAASYNERGIDGYASTVTDGKDQRKINSIYVPAINNIAGKRTLYLAKRPGFPNGSDCGNTTDTPFLITSVNKFTGSDSWVFSLDSDDDIVASKIGSAGNVVLSASGSFYPAFVDKTEISGATTAVLQLRTLFSDDAFAQRVFFASDITSWAEITDVDFAALFPMGKMEFVDGYAFVLNKNNRLHNSDLNSLSAWTSASFITKQIQQDSSVGLARLGRVLLAFGFETVEGFYNAGNTSGSPLGRIPQLSSSIGMPAGQPSVGAKPRHYYAILGQRMFFLGNERNAKRPACSFYMFDGSRFEKVSTPYIDKILSGRTIDAGSMTHVCALTVQGNPGVAIHLNDPTDTGTHKWLMFFPAWNEWFEWSSDYVQPENDGSFLIGIKSASGGKISLVTQSGAPSWVDGTSSSYTMTHQFKLPSQGNHRKFMPVCGVVGDTQSSGTLSVEFSDDDYASFQTARTIDLTSQKKQLYRCGSYRDRAVRLTHSANTDCRLEKFVAKVIE